MFVPLRCQSSFSMLESTIELKALAKAAAAAGFPAVGLTDRGNLFGAMAFSKACMDVSVQPVIGTLLPVLRDMPPGTLRPGSRPPVDYLALYARNEAGWANLLHLVSAAHMEGEAGLERLEGRTDGLLCLTGGADGALAKLYAEGQGEEAEALARRLTGLFGDRLYIEISRSGDPVEQSSELSLLRLAHGAGLPIVGTSPARFLEPNGYSAHDVMLCISEGAYLETADRRRSNPRHYLADEREMAERFHDLPEALAMTAHVARRSAFALKKRDPVLPKLVPDAEAEKAELHRLAEAGLRARLDDMQVADEAPYWDRLAFELGIIGQMGFSGYFLIVADFIQWSKEQDIPVGPGRGSGAGSAVAWALRITDLDPLALGLLFERFLNPERKSMPDFDIDFCETRREEVIRYVQRKYGREQVAQIITFGTLKARAVVKDVGRVMQLPYGQVNRLSNLIPANPADPWDLNRALNGVPELTAEMKADPKVKQLIEVGLQLEGRPRHSSTHAAGVVIGDRPLSELVPLYRDPRSDFPVTQFDLKWAEEAGLVKFDFLGLKTLSVLARAKKLLAERGTAIDLDHLPWDDQDVYALMTRGDTVGVFQFESEGMRRALALVKPTLFEDIIALGALYRPGPMDNIPSFAARKWGREEPDYLHPMLEPTLKPTYGVIIYQEQVMQIAQVLAGYSLGEADLLRRAMGKKIQAEMDAQRARFVDGAKANGVDAKQAESIFNLVDKFAGYGFNKSHAAAYALVAWQTAWLKHHHPAAFYAGSMAYDIHLTDKLAVFVDDMRRLDVPLLGPCINASGADFTLEDHEGRIAVRYALGALKGVGEGAMDDIVRERDAHGPFRSLDDFVNRIDPRALNRRQMEALAAAGAFDCFGVDRARVHAAAELLMGAATRAADARVTGQGGLFGGDSAAESVPLPDAKPWPLGERLSHERDAFGFWFSGHPVEAHSPVLKAMSVATATEVMARRAPAGTRTTAKMAGLVEDFRWRVPQGKGPDRRYMLADLTDQSGKWGASCFNAEAQAQVEASVAAGETLLMDVELQWREGDEAPRLAIQSARPLQELVRSTRALLSVRFRPGATTMALAELSAWLPRGGRSVVEATVPLAAGGEAVVRLGADFLLPAGAEVEIGALDMVAGAEISAMTQPLRLVA
ncbi:DNA polymerase III subunit alpha [Sandaracinobacter sp. RS1-74]|uniref:DNA polymerase III subunit alpha n=1 Tax=Sandaracinobacteroides sayramensis TaxID=2913411 RepID=UPI001EDA444A|nr:DNA polymerase III subunit alpha [Sandaracinobacteroides sayramensis]MCG2841660.1 DNA polymerase III subunit alpha [Sandaracinobacteroides sayramensis]